MKQQDETGGGSGVGGGGGGGVRDPGGDQKSGAQGDFLL